MAPPLIDTSIVPEVPGVLYALFDYGLTQQPDILPNYMTWSENIQATCAK